MTIADDIIAGPPAHAGGINPFARITASQYNELRDELLRLTNCRFPGGHESDVDEDEQTDADASSLPVGTIIALDLAVYAKSNPSWWHSNDPDFTALTDEQAQHQLDLGARILRHGYGDGT
jgi:hypothetical protein